MSRHLLPPIVAALLAGCAADGPAPAQPMKSASPAPSAPPPAPSAMAVAEPAPPPPTPLTADDPIVELPLPKGRPAVVSLPLGSTDARPILVATHGAGGRATTHCKLWRTVVGDRAFILCPRGYPIYPHGPPDETGYFYNGHPALAEEISLALVALAKTYGSRVDVADPLFAGYSQGANMGALVLPKHPARFSRAVLWEGGVGEFREWNIATAQRFHEHGGQRVLLACGRVKCYQAAQMTAGYMRQGGLTTRIVFVSGAGHTYAGKLGTKVAEAFAWLIEGDDRW